LTAKGRALQSGAKGDIVRVTNAASSRTINATVFEDGQVMAN
jgi:flagella basal body P-ring formation protein FlgA